MPAKSEKQRKMIFAKRGAYKTKAKTPEKWKWIWGKEWTKLEEETKPNVFDQYAEQMVGAAVGGANAPMSTSSIGLTPKNYVGTMRPKRKKKVKE